MKPDNVRIVSFSPCGGTERVAMALARDVGLPVTVHNWTLPANRAQKLDFGDKDLVFFVFPVYGGRMPQNIADLFSSLHGHDTPCVLAAVYGNREYEGALLDLYDVAVANGFKPVAAVAAVAEHSLAPEVATGRPDDSDRELLAAFGKKIMESCAAGHTLAKAPGEYPAWKSPKGTYFFPVTDLEKCVLCAHCADVCPTGAIPAANPASTAIDDCIVCGACAKYCPEDARVMGNQETRDNFRPHLLTAAARRKEAELFL